ncbi:MAG: chorismate-binding protein, partial [Methanomassiliicoccaceae archaeon]|nr:chorismate-binding protein [Methanomassiliicoccaceae archaeon]
MFRPTLEEAEDIAGTRQYQVIPISTEMYADIVTPIELLKILKNNSDHCFMLESAEDSKGWGRYTFLGFEPTMEVTCVNGVMTITSGSAETYATMEPNRYIQNILDGHKSPRLDYLPPFAGGLVGYFSYDYVKYSEPALDLDADDSEGFNDVDLMLFDKVIAFDHHRQKIILIVNVRADNIKEEYKRGVEELERLKNLISYGIPVPEEPVKLGSKFKALFTKDEFCGMVGKAKEHIRNGDIFQVVLSNRLEAKFDGSLLETYRALRTTNPSPYMFYMGGHDIEIVGASPETLVKLQDGKVFTFPLAGTRGRGRTHDEDIALEQSLITDQKELAEHNMLVDLGRNDLGKICRPGSVTVEKYLSVLRFSHVMHLG